MHNTKIRKENN